MKISNTPPHHVLSVSELMDETGAIVNDAVGLGDELTAIDRVPVRAMPVGDVVSEKGWKDARTAHTRMLQL